MGYQRMTLFKLLRFRGSLREGNNVTRRFTVVTGGGLRAPDDDRKGKPFSFTTRPGPLPLGDRQQQLEMEELIKKAQLHMEESPVSFAQANRENNEKINKEATPEDALPGFEGEVNPETKEVGGPKEVDPSPSKPTKVSWVERYVSEDWGVSRLDRFLMNHIGLSFNATHHIIRVGKVVLNNRRVKIPYRRIRPGDKVVLLYQEEVEVKKPLSYLEISGNTPTVLFKDHDILVINKPTGLAVQGGDHHEPHLGLYYEKFRFDANCLPRLVHRLDKEVTGLLVLGRNHRATVALAHLFQEKEDRGVTKLYLAVIQGSPSKDSGQLTRAIYYGETGFPRLAKSYERDHPAVKPASTHYWVITRTREFSLVALRLVTGRKHQIRLHLAHELGMPIVGDKLYGRKASAVTSPPPILLHSFCLKLKYPLFPATNDDAPATSTVSLTPDLTSLPLALRRLTDPAPGQISLVAPLFDHFTDFLTRQALHPHDRATDSPPEPFRPPSQ